MTETTDPQDITSYLGSAAPRVWWKRRWVWAVALLVLALIAAGIWQNLRGDDQPDYITGEVSSRSLDLEVTATGNLRPTNQVEVGSEVSGRIDRVLVDVNDRVSQGQVLAIINTDVIADQITQGRASVNAARAVVAQARATLDVDRAQLDRLREVFRLSDGRVPSRTEMEQAEGTLRRSQAGLASAQANVSSAEASLSSALTQGERAVIRSPVSGVVLARQVEPGQTVAASFNTPTLFVLAEDLATMQLRVKVDEADVGQVQPGQEASFTVDAWPGRRFPALVQRIDLASTNIATAGEQQSGSQQGTAVVEYEARLTVANGEGLLRPGMTATANIATSSTGQQLVVPNGALRFEPPETDNGPDGVRLEEESFGLEREDDRARASAGSRQRLHVLDADGTLRPIVVTTGLSDGRFTVVTGDGIEAGMKVVTGIRATEE